MATTKLQINEIEIFTVDLSQLTKQSNLVDSCWQLLTDDEKTRAQRFVTQKLQKKFILTRGLLRKFLVNYLTIPAQQIIFEYNKYGKPSLANIHKTTPLSFNLSHSHDLALYAFCQDGEVGIDVEYVREVAFADLAKRFFTTQETEQITQQPKNEQKNAFFQCWTKKEAIIKAEGVGIANSLQNFSVDVFKKQQIQTLNKTWNLLNLTTSEGYAAALATTLKDPIIKPQHFAH